MSDSSPRAITANRRALIQAAKFAIRDIFDAIAELVTNADDRYQVLGVRGRIEIEIERRRGKGHLLRVRDFADGMDATTMDRKLSTMGGRESGLAEGAEVRGTHSRGAKDIAALGKVTFESIAQDGNYHRCEITPFLEFITPHTKKVTAALREALGIPEGTGTQVTIDLDDSVSIPHHDNLRTQLQRLVPLRAILKDETRSILLRDLGQDRDHNLRLPKVQGVERLKERLEVPGYPTANAKLTIVRSTRRFEREPERFRLGGVQIESRRAVHEATLFDSALENDPHALWFTGRLVCPYIDDLCNEFDERFESKQPPSPQNPKYPLDPSRKTGLNREHPFVKALFAQALRRLRPLVEEERAREERERASIENQATRKRLNALEKAALEFMRDYELEDEPARDPDGATPESRFMERGFAISPPYAQIIVGHARQFWLSVRQDAFPELAVGDGVHIECLSKDVSTDARVRGLEQHPTRDGVLRALWTVTAEAPTPATGVRAQVGPVSVESAVEVLTSEADLYRHVDSLRFSHKRYRISTSKKKKKLRLLAPIALAPRPSEVAVTIDSSKFQLHGERLLRPHPLLGIAFCDLLVSSDGREGGGQISAALGGQIATAEILAEPPRGADLSIKIEDVDLENQRYRWRHNVLELAARHPSLMRYLGQKDKGFPGQESKHFRVLIAEVVAEAICARLVRRNVDLSPEEFENADWDTYYALFTKYMTAFLPIAHKLQCPEG